jgi:cytochrome c-type biogenesis protein CcsB
VSPVEFTTFWITVFAYTIGTGLALFGVAFNRQRPLTLGALACFGGLAAHVAAVAARIVHTGHLPVASLYENILTGAVAVMLFNLVAIWRRRELQPMLVFTAPFTLLMLGYALLNQPRFTTMSLVLDNLWMFVHVFFSWLAYGAYSVAAAVGVLYLIRDAKRFDDVRGEQLPGLLQRVPSRPVIDDLMFRFSIFGFVAHVVMISSGSIWARDLWGAYWSWDPVETWSLLSLLLYGLWIHLRLTLRWRGRRMAWMSVGMLVTVLFAFWGTNLLGSTSHSLDDLSLKLPEETLAEPGD